MGEVIGNEEDTLKLSKIMRWHVHNILSLLSIIDSEGHKKFLKQAKALGDYLVVVVAQDHIIEHLKGQLPKINLESRFKHLEDIDEVDEVVIGDAELGTWSVIKKYKPGVIAFGYDQTALKDELEKHLKASADYKPQVKVLKAHEPEKYHSSILSKKK